MSGNERLPPPIPLRSMLKAASGIIVGGVRIPLPGRTVLTWLEHKVQFRAGQGANKRRVDDVNLVVWHWTGAENPPLTMARTLEKRELGIEFAIDTNGAIYQFCDPLVVDTADAGKVNAGKVNARSVGVEIVSYGVKSLDRAWIVPTRGRDRVLEPQRIHGKTFQVASFHEGQVRAARSLAEALSLALKIPRLVPRDAYGNVDGQIFSAYNLRRFEGHCGHLHVSAQKLDPGTKLLEQLFDYPPAAAPSPTGAAA